MASQTIWSGVLFAVILSIFVLSGILLYSFIDVLLLALLTAYLASPLTEKIHEYGKKAPKKFRWVLARHSFAATLSFILIILPFVFVTLQTINIISNPAGTQVFLDILYFSPEFSSKVKATLDYIGLEAFSDTISEKIRDTMAALLTKSSSAVASIAGNLLIAIPIYLITTFYFINDGVAIVKKIRGYIPKKERFLTNLFEEACKISRSLFIGFFLTSIAVGIIATIGFWTLSLLGIFTLKSFAYAVFLGILTAILALLPIVGAYTVFVPISVWILLNQTGPASVTNALIVLSFGVIFLNIIPDFFIKPKLSGLGTQIHPLIVILGVIGGSLLWGAKGFILGPVSLALSQAIIERFIRYEEKKEIFVRYEKKKRERKEKRD